MMHSWRIPVLHCTPFLTKVLPPALHRSIPVGGVDYPATNSHYAMRCTPGCPIQKIHGLHILVNLRQLQRIGSTIFKGVGFIVIVKGSCGGQRYQGWWRGLRRMMREGGIDGQDSGGFNKGRIKHRDNGGHVGIMTHIVILICWEP
jgi:hypothetical protein